MPRVVALAIALLALVPAASASQASRVAVPECDTMPNPASRLARAARPRDLDFRVRYSAEETASGTRVQWLLTLRNRTRRAVWIAFPTSQYADVVVRQGGRLEHWWGSRRAWLQAFHHRVLRPRETYACKLDRVRLELAPGRYELRAFLRSTIRVETRRSLLVNG